jgi:hypothetical protein
MALAKTLRQRIYDMFSTDGGGNTIIRTSAVGTFTFSGLSQSIKVTNMTVDDTPDPIPAVSLTGRNSIMIYNRDPIEKLYIGDSGVEASGVNEGWIIDPESYLPFDITDGIVLYAIASAGKTVQIKVMELA